MSVIRGVLCDLDGTVANSEWAHVEAWNVLAKKYRLDTPDGWTDDYVGKANEYQADKMLLAYPFLPPKKELLRERHAIYQNLVRNNAEKVRYPGVSEGLQALTEKGYAIALGSNSPMENCITALEAAAIVEYFQVIVAYGMVRAGKPAPDIYLEAARQLGLEPRECAVVEDTEVGVTSGKAAGCLVLGVLTTSSPESLRAADMMFPDTAAALNWLAEYAEEAKRA